MVAGQPGFSKMRDAEIADWQYDEPDAALGQRRLRDRRGHARQGRGDGHIVRMPPGELDQIRAAAAADGVTMSEWIGNACKAALGKPAPAPVPDRAHIIGLLDVLRRTVEETDRTVPDGLLAAWHVRSVGGRATRSSHL